MRQKEVDGLDFGNLNKFGVPSCFTPKFALNTLPGYCTPLLSHHHQAAENGGVVEDEGGMVEEEGDAG